MDFNFPGFDGELVDGLPKGWRKGNVGDIISYKNGKSSPEKRDDKEYPVYGSNGIIGYANDYDRINNHLEQHAIGRKIYRVMCFFDKDYPYT